MHDNNRLDDFYNLLAAIADGYLEDNIALHLMLEIGQFYSYDSIHSMRYSETSLTFWATVQKIFKGKCVNFFRGHKGEGVRDANDGAISPVDCRINFAVPSDQILAQFTKKYKLEVLNPGIMDTLIDSYTDAFPDTSVKLSMDEKTLCYGLGKGGEEDLCGHETSPTLLERQKRHKQELDNLQQCKE